jgi:hypothetical protein
VVSEVVWPLRCMYRSIIDTSYCDWPGQFVFTPNQKPLLTAAPLVAKLAVQLGTGATQSWLEKRREFH